MDTHEKLQIEKQAIAWFVRLRSGQCTSEERSEFVEWYKGPQQRVAFLDISALWGTLGQYAERPAVQQMRRLCRQEFDGG